VGVGWAVFLGWVLALLLWAVVVLWVWLPSAGDVAEFLAGEARLGRLSLESLERLRRLAVAAGEFESMFFGDGDGGVTCLGYYVVWWGGGFRVYVVVAYYSSNGPFIEAIDVEEWVVVSRAKGLAARV
jgi:hypothetical protein